jgi:hypothetical protein
MEHMLDITNASDRSLGLLFREVRVKKAFEVQYAELEAALMMLPETAAESDDASAKT